MQFRKNYIVYFILLILLLVTACGQDQGQEEDIDEEPNGEENVYAELQFEELDLKGLEDDKLLAEYEGGEIYGEEFATYLAIQGFLNPIGTRDNAPINNLNFRDEIIKFLIMEKILIPQVEDDAWAIGKAEEEWETIQAFYGEENINAGFNIYGLSEEDINQSLVNLFMIEEYFRERVTEQEINIVYESYRDRLTSTDVRHILIKTHDRDTDQNFEQIREEDEAEQMISDIYDQLLAGADFAELATEHSEDLGSRHKGGLIENANPESFVAEFKEAIETQEIGQFGSPIQTQFGFHIVQVEALRERTKDDVREELLVPTITYQKFADYYSTTLPEYIKAIHII